MEGGSELEARLATPARWVVTGAAGFIGSHLVERLLGAGQNVVGLDNFATGHRRNLELAVAESGGRGRFEFVEGDIAELETCRRVVAGAHYVLHQAALGSVPRSIEAPLDTHRANVDGFLNVVLASREATVRRLVYASSSSVYGDDPGLPKDESRIGRALSPYAATKRANEIYAGVFHRVYGLTCIGLRYFNVFGPRQDPRGAYAAVIPRWVTAMAEGRPCTVFGDGLTSRDFCYVANAVQANLRAALVEPAPGPDRVYNVALGRRTSLNELHSMIRQRVARAVPSALRLEPVHAPPRPGDIRDSEADISAATRDLGYRPTHSVAQGLDVTIPSFLERVS